MSVQFDIASSPADRRAAPRFRFDILMPALLAHRNALVLDVSATGARVMHYSAQASGSRVRLVFSYGGRRFSATAEVLASRVTGLGNGPDGATSYESRLRFLDATAGELEAITEQIECERLRTWVSNIAGDERPPQADAEGSGYYLRCRWIYRGWVKRWTHDSSQPETGFTVPAKLGAREIQLLCEAYENADDDGRALIRATAALAA